jgi:hypothetical protein
MHVGIGEKGEGDELEDKEGCLMPRNLLKRKRTMNYTNVEDSCFHAGMGECLTRCRVPQRPNREEVLTTN